MSVYAGNLEIKGAALQNFCLTASSGHRWMHLHDRWPEEIRHRISTSPFNLCTACIRDKAYCLFYGKHFALCPKDFVFATTKEIFCVTRAITIMEAAIRKNVSVQYLLEMEIMYGRTHNDRLQDTRRA